MKIDVEGGELGVLQSGDWERFRPRLLIVEATVVNSKEENWQSWEPILIEANYHKVWFDGLNNSTCGRRTWSCVMLSGCRQTFMMDSKPPSSPG
jgi:hypothetical protein